MTENSHDETRDAEDNERIDALTAIPSSVRKVTEDNLALDFAADNVGWLRHAGQWNRWMFWNDTHWEVDYAVRSCGRCREFLRGVYDETTDGYYQHLCVETDFTRFKTADEKRAERRRLRNKAEMQCKAILNLRTVQNVTNMSRSDERIRSDVAQWDGDPWLLNTPDGTVDLRTGVMKAA